MLLVGVCMTPSHGGKFPHFQSSTNVSPHEVGFGKGLVKMSLIHRTGLKKVLKSTKNAQKLSCKGPDRLSKVHN